MKLCILTPTIYRPAGLRRSLKSLLNSLDPLYLAESGIDVSVMVAAEHDDETAPLIAAEFGAGFSVCKEYRGGPASGWNTALAAAPDCDAYFTGSDDVEYHPGWLEAVMEVLNNELHGSGLVGINDGRWDRKKVYEMCATHYLMTRDFIVNHNGGVAAAPFYHADFTDMEANARARRAGCWAWAEKALVQHHRGGSLSDLGYRNASAQRPKMRPLYDERKRKGFPDDFEAILT